MKMVDRAELVDVFKIFGTTLSGKVLEKCEELCNTYGLSPEELSDQWGACSAGSTNDAIPTLAALDVMERKELKKQQNKNFSATSTPTAAKIYKDDVQDLDQDLLIMNSYSTPKSNKTSNKRIRSPEDNSVQKRFQPGQLNFSPGANFSPSSYSPAVNTQSSDYAGRTDSGNVMLSYGQHLLKKATFKRLADQQETLVSVSLYSEEDRLPSDARYMYEVMNAKAASLSYVTESLGNSLIDKYKLEEPQPFGKAPGLMTTYGRICCDGEGKLNAASVLLEGSQEFVRGATVQLNVNKLPNYAVFPGQVVAVQGYNPNGNVFVAEKIYTDASISSPMPNCARFREPLQIVVAAGPFTLRNNLLYQPLQDLMKYVTSNVPHILILMGPFVDVSQENITDVTMAESYDTFFETLVSHVITPLESLNVQVVFIASHKDAHHHIVYPTPPYVLRKKYPNLHCVADPSLINIGGVIVGATSVDVLFHLGKEEVCSSSQGGDRMSRLASHLLGQKSFYPLYPPDESVCIDHEFLEHYALMEVIPHILIVPSNLRYFIKNVNGCLVVNPERLAKGYVGGTFARAEIFPSTTDFTNNVVAQVIRI